MQPNLKRLLRALAREGLKVTYPGSARGGGNRWHEGNGDLDGVARGQGPECIAVIGDRGAWRHRGSAPRQDAPWNSHGDADSEDRSQIVP